MSTELATSARLVVDGIVSLADRDVEFRSALADVLRALSQTDTTKAENEPHVESETASESDSDGLAIEGSPNETALPVSGIVTIQRSREPLQTDLSVIEARCRLKAEGARWAADRQRCLTDGIPFSTAIEPRDEELIERAKQAGCFLWMNTQNGPRPDDMGLFDVLGSCFDMAAEAAALLRECALEAEDKGLFRECLDIAAEAQSALRSAVMAVEAVTDSDQQSLYHWIKSTASEKGIFVKRYLRGDDLADPYSSADIRNRLQAIRGKCQLVIEQRRQRRRWQSKLGYHAKHILENGSSDHDWNTIAEMADEMVRDGVPPSNREIREAILPIIDTVPTSTLLPRAFQLVLREAETYRAGQDQPPVYQDESEPTADVLAVRGYLKNKIIVIIGGDSVDGKRQAIKRAFALKDVEWVDSRHHQSIERFKPAIIRADVKVVILMVRWASHSYHDLKPFCDQHGKLFVRLPGGYNPNQLASQIMAQCGYLLRQEAASVASQEEGQET